MYFYIDESGQTGNNLFDQVQPVLYYGVLSSKTNLDILAKPTLLSLKKKLGVGELHASELKNEGLVKIVPELLCLIKKYRLSFDFFKLVKIDYALICFFDQVFDQGVNPAVPHLYYWSPLRFALLLTIAPLFDDKTLQRAWCALIELDNKKAEAELVEICRVIINRLDLILDQRCRQVVQDVLQWVIDHPDKIYYNYKDTLQVAPNLVGFQFVIFDIASRSIKNNKQASRIIVDEQLQFNEAQQKLARYYSILPHDTYSIFKSLRLTNKSLKKMPSTPLTFLSGKVSSGLELVDIFLWIFKRNIEGKFINEGLTPIINKLICRCNTEEISIHAIESNWIRSLKQIPHLTDEDIQEGVKFGKADEKRRLQALKK